MSTKHTQGNLTRLKDLKKPFGFCCDIRKQDLDMQYDMYNPPFESAFINIPLVTSRPNVQLRIEDNEKPPSPIQRTVALCTGAKVKKAVIYDRKRKGRGPLTCFLEDEIEAARDAYAEEKKIKWKEMHKKIIKSRMRRKADKVNIQDNTHRMSGVNVTKPEREADNKAIN